MPGRGWNRSRLETEERAEAVELKCLSQLADKQGENMASQLHVYAGSERPGVEHYAPE